MRGGLLVLLAPLVFSGSVVAQTLVSGVIHGDQIVFPAGEFVMARVSPDEVVSRMLTFDRDRDGKVNESELAERMQPLMARGDSNRDGVLDPAEIRSLAVAPPATVAHQGRIGGPFGSSYGFADDEDSFSSRKHIEGAIEDLKLAADANEQAQSIALAFVDALEADSAADLIKDLEGVISPQQLNLVQQMLEEPSPRRVITLRSKDGSTVTRTFFASGVANLQARMASFGLTPEHSRQARAAVDRYAARIKMGGAGERAALVDQLKAVLNAEERDNLGAALARRPVVATGKTVTLAAALDLIALRR